MNGGTSGWTNYCDRNRKENFRPVDGEQLLLRIRLLAIDEWNYKGTDPSIRYIGPVAQDFYAAFKLGGGDSLGINSICIDGVNIAAIQALEKRTAHLRETTSKLASLQQRVDGLEMENAALRSKLQAIEQAVERLCALSGQGTQRVFVSR
jgi:hypothetical protein